jgi:hypothetical protein
MKQAKQTIETRIAKKRIYDNNRKEIQKKKYDLVKDTKEFKDKKKNSVLKSAYNISLDDYNKMFNDQNGRCKICLIHNSEVKKPLSVDHYHSTGKVRGLLCGSCNLGLGMFKDNTEIMKIAIEYLNEK